MSDYEVVFGATKTLERLLEERFGAEGRGLHEKASSVEHLLDARVLRQLRYVATIRNKLAHEEGYRVNDIERFSRTCTELQTALTQGAAQSGHAAHSPQSPLTQGTRLGAQGELGQWRGAFVLCVWLGAGLDMVLTSPEPWEAVPDGLYGLALTLLAGSRTLMSDGSDSPGVGAWLLSALLAVSLAVSIGRQVGGWSGAAVVFIGTLGAIWMFFALGRVSGVGKVLAGIGWMSRFLFRSVVWVVGLSAAGGALWWLAQLFITNWKPAA